MQSKLRPTPGQTGPGGLATGWLAYQLPPQVPPKPGALCTCLLCFLLLLEMALAGSTIGTITSEVAQMANVKNRIADLLMRFS